MRVRLLSDLHFEFHKDGGESFVKELNNDCDVLIVAGDLCSSREIHKSLRLLSRRFSKSQILYVMGNHEFYYTNNKEKFLQEVNLTIKSLSNVKLLNNSVEIINGQRFLGSTLWFEHDGKPDALDKSMNDFQCIGDMYDWISEQEKSNIDYISSNLKKSDVVITHHLPHVQCVQDKYASSPMNKFFVHYSAYDIASSGLAAYWLFGHTHSKIDKNINGTRFMANPFGYIGYENTSLCDLNFNIDI